MVETSLISVMVTLIFPTHSSVVDKLIESAQNKKNHKYSVSKGILGLRTAMKDRYKRIYDSGFARG
ncbi:MAG: hypothetical protein ACJ0F9_00895 [Candidatus Actinomarina sp.]